VTAFMLMQLLYEVNFLYRLTMAAGRAAAEPYGPVHRRLLFRYCALLLPL